MLGIILLVSSISASMSTQSLWGQCAGNGYSGDNVCVSGSRFVSSTKEDVGNSLKNDSPFC